MRAAGISLIFIVAIFIVEYNHISSIFDYQAGSLNNSSQGIDDFLNNGKRIVEYLKVLGIIQLILLSYAGLTLYLRSKSLRKELNLINKKLEEFNKKD